MNREFHPSVTPLVGDLFESEAQTLVNTVNTVGVMGKGIALEFKRRFPAMFREYEVMTERGAVRLGEPYLWKQMIPPWVLNFPTKEHWRSSARLSDIVGGLRYLEQNYRDWGITSLAVPPLGCGEGGLEWRVVGPTLYQHLSRLEIPVELYAPFGTPVAELGHDFLSQPISDAAGVSLKLSPGSVALAEIVARVSAESYHYPVGRVAFQKLAYFASQAGIPTALEFHEDSYGPFAPDLARVRSRLLNNGVLTEERQGQAFVARPGPTFEHARRAYGSWIQKWEEPINRVADLFLRMSGRQAEVAATIHFAAQQLKRNSTIQPSEIDVLNYVQRWKQRRKPSITGREYGSAIRHLNLLGWLDLSMSSNLPLPDHDRELVEVG